MREFPLRPSLLFVGLVAVWPAAGVGAQDAALLAEEAAGSVSVDEEIKVVAVSNVKGSVTLVPSETASEIQFLSYTADAKRELLPIRVELQGGTLRFEPRRTGEAVEHSLLVYLPKALDVELDLAGTTVNATALPGGLTVHGKRLALTVHGVRGSAVVDLEGGTAALSGVEKSATVQGRDVALQVEDVEVQLSLRLSGGVARAAGVKGSVKADTEGTALSIQDSGEVTVKSRMGRVDLVNVGDADLSLTGSPLTLVRVRGETDVTTDSEVKFTDTRAALRFDGYGATLRGSGNEGLVEVRTHNAEVALERISGPVRIEGEGLKVRLKDLASETLVYVQRSDVEVSGNKQHLVIDSSDGNVTVRNSAALVEVRATGGTVQMIDLRSSVELQADVKEIEVSWAVLPSDKDSRLENTGGTLKVHFPENGSCRIEARTKVGRIESNLAHLEIDPEGSSANGRIGAGVGRTIRLNAGLNIELTGGPKSADEQR